ncbi:sirohydrochlorin cobaltochelatase [Veillonella agrestimuris]|uniref:sirohydrochlorin cobaltochelatase n=1 Tax=Veillonella agrestimuris TaxID=2941340 RepID=UPI00203FD413|nr:sirohydrochlorin cobaltochelatase [Veillonella agrestimuris]
MKGIIIASFGSIYKEAVDTSISVIERKVRELYKGFEVRRVFLSDALVEKWNGKYDEPVSSLAEVMKEFQKLGITEVYIQPITLVADQCYQQMRKQALKYLHSNDYNFTHINIGKPLLTSLGVKNYSDDYEATLDGILRHLNTKALNKSILLMANGQNQLEYSTLQLKAIYGSTPNVVVFTTNGFPTFKQALTLVEHMGHKDVIVVPLALIGSTHLMDYLGGDRSDSIYTLLVEEGYNVRIWNEGLGENPYIQDLFLKHLSQAIRMAERKRVSPQDSIKPAPAAVRVGISKMIS